MYNPRTLGSGLNQAQIQAAQVVNNTYGKDRLWGIEGFQERFGEDYRKTFDPKYYEQLWEETFKYKHMIPLVYITHLKTKHVVMVTIVIAHLKKEALRDW